MSIDHRALPGAILLAALSLFSFLSHNTWLFSLCALGLFGHLAFFRDPSRKPDGPGVLAPADGLVTDISTVREERFLNEEAVKVGLFLSVFVPHVNRAPVQGTVLYCRYEPGSFMNALNPASVDKNESQWVGFGGSGTKVLVRLIAGMIARRIHSDVKPDQAVERGSKIGIICYGSRAECYFPKSKYKPAVAIGDRVRAGETVIGKE